MTVIRETERAKQLEHDGIQFWIQKRWQRPDGTLTLAGKKAMAIAADIKRRHADFDATKVFDVVYKTASAVHLSCKVEIPSYGKDSPVEARFWIPMSMICDYRFVAKKIKEVEESYPFIGTKVIWRQA